MFMSNQQQNELLTLPALTEPTTRQLQTTSFCTEDLTLLLLNLLNINDSAQDYYFVYAAGAWSTPTIDTSQGATDEPY